MGLADRILGKRGPKFEVYADTAGQFRFRFRASNHEIIASGEGYVEKRDCLHAIELLKTECPKAPIDDQTLGGLLGRK